MSANNSPPILRPIPRRPFDLNIAGPASPPEEDSSVPPSPSPNDIQLLTSRFLDPRGGSSHNASSTSLAEQQGGGSGSLSRAQSIMNLTASTLFGIYSPTALSSARGSSGYYNNDRSEPGTPWGTGAESPVKRLNVDEPTYELMKGRSRLLSRRKSTQSNGAAKMVVTGPPPSKTMIILSLAARAALLFGLGTGYGLFVSRLHDRHKLTGLSVEGIVNPGLEWQYLLFWGVAGVVLGALLPWFDSVWDQMFSRASQASTDHDENENEKEEDDEDEGTSPGTDWALVIRGIGAFAGIVFAIRKLPWASTMQVSLTLALVNPFLWYLIDRSKSGFLLATTVGLTGSSILLGFNPAMMPTPASAHHALGAGHANVTGSNGHDEPPLALGGLARKETIETGIWMLSVLFCSCVCFGNIGRRLALDGSAAARGRWGGVR